MGFVPRSAPRTRELVVLEALYVSKEFPSISPPSVLSSAADCLIKVLELRGVELAHESERE